MNGLKLISVIIFLCTLLVACTEDADVQNIVSSHQNTWKSPLSRTIENPITTQDFKRTYGVGFSYDGLHGELCNLKDIKSQVLDYQKVKEALNGTLIKTNSDNSVRFKQYATFNRDEFYQHTMFKADLELNAIIFNGKIEGDVSLIEKGERNDFFCKVELECPSLQVSLNKQSLKSLIQNRNQEQLLTPNFREVISWLKAHHDIATIDSFIERYGTHVVTSANLGGSIAIQIHMSADSLTDLYTKKTLGEAAIATLFKTKTLSEEYKRINYMLYSADCNIKIKGGDLSLIPNDVLRFTYGESPDLPKFIGGWTESLCYDQKDFQKSNLEIIEMAVSPIWDFIPDKTISSLIRQRISGTASEFQKVNGFLNNVSTTFELPQSVTCTIGGTTQSYRQPQTVNVISGERYVATICRERIPEIDPSSEVQVVYPILDRQVNLLSGFCVHKSKAYRVSCHKDKMITEYIGNTSSGTTIYLNNGVADTIKYENLDYQPSHLVMDYEWPYSIKPDGTLDKTKPYYWVYKKGVTFYLRTRDGKEQMGELDGLPNCIYQNGRMVRAPKYHYYWNPLEMRY